MNYTVEELRTALRQVDEQIAYCRDAMRRGVNIKPSTWEELRDRQGKLIDALAHSVEF